MRRSPPAVRRTVAVGLAAASVLAMLVVIAPASSASNHVVPCVAPPPNMTAWYPGDETTGTQARNLRPPSPNATLVNGASFAAAKVGNGFQFDGIDDFVQTTTSDPDVGVGDFSIDFWVQTTATGVRTVIDKRAGSIGTTLQGYAVVIFNGNILLQMANGGAFTNYLSGAFVSDGLWHHVAITVDRNNPQGILFYKDGNLVTTGDPTGRQGSLDNTSPLTLGRDLLGIVSNFQGMLDEVEIFSRVLTAPEIQGIALADSSGKCKGAWIPTSGSLSAPGQSSHTATLLTGSPAQCGSRCGMVLVTGDMPAQLYDPVADDWTPISSPTKVRAGATATLLTGSAAQCGSSCGKVLIAGGRPDNSAELYDPVSNTFSPTTAMASPRQGHTATLLTATPCGTNCGRVLVTGGVGDGSQSDTTELYHPASGTWTNGPPMAVPRQYHTATLLQGAGCAPLCGTVLVAGGVQSGAPTTAEVYTPTSGGTWSVTAPMSTDRRLATATLLAGPDVPGQLRGEVLVAGGYDYGTFQASSSAERFDPSGPVWRTEANMGQGRFFHAATQLVAGCGAQCGQVLVAGGEVNTCNLGGLSSSERYTPPLTSTGVGTWTPAPDMNQGRSRFTLTLLRGPGVPGYRNGHVLAVGGTDLPSVCQNRTATSERYDPTP